MLAACRFDPNELLLVKVVACGGVALRAKMLLLLLLLIPHEVGEGMGEAGWLLLC